jgi:hypothetical protein
MAIKKLESKIKPAFRLSGDQVDLRTLDTNIVVDFLEAQIKAREMPVEQHVKKAFRRI